MPSFHLHVDPRIAFLILVFAAVFSIGQALYGLFSVGKNKLAVNRRLAVAESGVSLGELVVELRKQRGLNERGESIIGWAWLSASRSTR